MTTLSGYLRNFVFITALAILPFTANHAYGMAPTAQENTLIAARHGGTGHHHGGGGHWSGGGGHHRGGYWGGGRWGGRGWHGDRGYRHNYRNWDGWGGGWYWSYPHSYNNYYYRGYNYYPYSYYPDYYYRYNSPYYYDNGSGFYLRFGY